jgi:HSP20 family protein
MAHDLIRLTHSLFLPAAQAAREAAWQPSADVYRTRDGWLVKLDLAGVRPGDVEVSAGGGRLTVRGVRHDCCVHEGCCHYQMEISYSRFERSLTLPADLERAQIDAEHRDGMLLIHIHQEGNPR